MSSFRPTGRGALTRASSVVPAFALALMLTACGGGGGGDTNPPTGPSPGASAPTAPTATAPVIVSLVLPDSVAEGGAGEMRLTLAGADTSYVYEWHLDGVLLPHTGPAVALQSLVLSAGTHRIQVTVRNGAGLSSVMERELTVTAAIVPPTTTGLTSLSVQAGQSADFSVVAGGTGPFSYQWRRNGVDIDGAITSALHLDAVALADDGARFDVVVRSGTSQLTTTSAAAILSVTAAPVAPTLVLPPLPQTAVIGYSVPFTVVAQGTAPFTYQWRRDGVDVAGATNSTWMVAPVSLQEDGALVSVTVTNSVGAVTSPPVRLTVSAFPTPPRFTAQPLSQVVTVGARPTFDLEVAPADSTSITWLSNASALDGATGRSFQSAAIAASDHGAVFGANARNLAGQANSAAAQLFVAASDTGRIERLAGSTGGAGNLDGAATDARLGGIAGLAADGAGNLWIVEARQHTVRRVDSAGQVTTVAGASGSAGSADGRGIAARFNSPSAIAVAADGAVYVADTGNHTIRRIATDGMVSTLAGLAASAGAADGRGAAARFNGPSSIAVDAQGDLIVADTENHIVRRVTRTGEVSTIAGMAGERGNADGPRTIARLETPSHVAVDPAGAIFVVDNGDRLLRRIAADGQVGTVAGQRGDPASIGTDGPLGTSTLGYVRGMAADAVGVVTWLQVPGAGGFGAFKARRLQADGTVRTLFNYGAQSPAIVDETPSDRLPVSASAIVRTDAGRYAISAGSTMGSAHVVLNLDETGRGDIRVGQVSFYADSQSPAPAQRFAPHADVLVDPRNGDALVVEAGRIRRVAADGTVTFVANTPSFLDSTFSKRCPAVDASGNVFALDGYGISRTSPQGIASRLPLLLPNARCLALDRMRNRLYVIEGTAVYQLEVDGSGSPTLFAGHATAQAWSDGTGADARFVRTGAAAIDAAGNLHLVDYAGNTVRVRRITPAGVVSTLATLPVTSTDRIADYGGGASIGTSPIVRLAVDDLGNVYLSNATQHTIDRIDPNGRVTILAGHPRHMGVAVGALPGSLYFPAGIAVSPDGRDLFVNDEGALLRIRRP